MMFFISREKCIGHNYAHTATGKMVQKTPEMNSSRAVHVSRHQKIYRVPKIDEVGESESCDFFWQKKVTSRGGSDFAL